MIASTDQPQEFVLSRPSRWGLVWRSFVWLLVTVVLGVVVALPVMLFRASSYYEVIYRLDESPPDDAHLLDWGQAERAVESFKVERRAGDLWIRAEYRGFMPRPPQAAIDAQLLVLGYRVGEAEVGAEEIAANLDELENNPWVLGTELLNLQVAMILVPLVGIRWARRKGQPLPPLFAGRTRRAAAAGVATGLGLIALGFGYYKMLEALLGHAPPSPWDSVESMPIASKIVLLALGAIGAPVAEEIFFRGFLFGRFISAGYVVCGMVFTALLFAAIHIADPYGMPGIFLIGLVLAWLYNRTKSLVAPVTAHVVNNALAIGMTLIGIE